MSLNQSAYLMSHDVGPLQHQGALVVSEDLSFSPLQHHFNEFIYRYWNFYFKLSRKVELWQHLNSLVFFFNFKSCVRG